MTRNEIFSQPVKRYTTEKRGGAQTELALSELEDCIPSSVTAEQIVEEKALAASVRRFLCAQPERKRNIFIRRYWYLCSIRDIAGTYAKCIEGTA